MNERHTVKGLAVGTNCWLSNSSSVDLYSPSLLADITPANKYVMNLRKRFILRTCKCKLSKLN